MKRLQVFREENVSAGQALLTGRVGDDGPAALCDLRRTLLSLLWTEYSPTWKWLMPQA